MSHDWIIKRAKVAELASHAVAETASLATVERLTATQIVLDNGNRYRRDNLQPVGGNSSYTFRTLLRPDDPRVLRALAGALIRTLKYRIDELAKGKTGVDGLTAYLDAVEAECAKARSKLGAWSEVTR